MDWLWNQVTGFLIGWVPLWVWVIVAGLLLGWAWKTFGWQGVVGGLLALLTLGAYRQGWRDRDGRDRGVKPLVPIEDFEKPLAPPPAKKKRKTIIDMLKDRTGQ